MNKKIQDETVLINAERKAAEVIAVIATLQYLSADRIAGKALRKNSLYANTKRAIPLVISLSTGTRARPQPTAIRQLVDKAHETLNIFLFKSKRN